MITCILLVVALPRLKAADIVARGGQPGANHFQSDGTTPIPPDAGFFFEVGTFANGFIPNAANTDDWLANWSPITDASGAPRVDATDEYTTITSPLFGSFPGWDIQSELEHANAPFTPGTRGYVWGFDNRTTPGSGQWILLTHSTDWTYPNGTSPIAPTETWTVGNANHSETLIGSVSGAEITLGAVTISTNSLAAISIADASANEEGGTMQFTISLDAPTTSAVSVAYTLQPVTASGGVDYGASGGTINIPAGGSSATLSVNLISDTLAETNETFEAILSSPTGAIIADGSGAGTIYDDDAITELEHSACFTQPGGGTLGLQWTAVIGRSYSIEFSTDLVNWTPVSSGAGMTATSTTESFTLPTHSQPRCFYRITDDAAGP